MQIRRAIPSDIPDLLPMMRDFSKFYGSKKPLYRDDETAIELLRGMIESHIVMAAEKNRGLVGVIGGIIGPNYFNPDIINLTETFWWVDPAHRRSSAGLGLLEAFISYGRANADWISFTLECESPVRNETLTRRGFVLKEKNFILEI